MAAAGIGRSGAVEEKVLTREFAAASRFKGYKTYRVQNAVLRARAARYRRERRLPPVGPTVVAPLPADVRGHFALELRRFALLRCHQELVTVERPTAHLQAQGVGISKPQVTRLLIDRQDAFLEEGRDVLRAGLHVAALLTVDDTGARLGNANGF